MFKWIFLFLAFEYEIDAIVNEAFDKRQILSSGFATIKQSVPKCCKATLHKLCVFIVSDNLMLLKGTLH